MKKTIEINTTKTYTLEEASKLLPELSTSKFVGSVDIDIVLNLKEKQKKEIVRGGVTLPHSMGDTKTVAVICDEKDEKLALEAGADAAGVKVVEEILKGKLFDVIIATPAMMAQIAKAAKILGPKGLMPNPKNGTVTADVSKAVTSFKAGRLNFKSVADQGAIRLKVAKVDMGAEKIQENIVALLKAIHSEAKKLASNPFKRVTVSPTMGAGLKLDVNDIIKYI
jgi:large subunit ribosomal protein L1